VTAVSLEIQHLKFSGHMVAVMALMEAPAIIVGVILIECRQKTRVKTSLGSLIQHSYQRSVLDLRSLIIGMLASDEKHWNQTFHE
jgi:hypothetical protein